MDIQAAFGEQALRLDGGGKLLGGSMIQYLWRFCRGELHIYLDGMALVGPDLCPILIKGIPLLAVALDDLLQQGNGRLICFYPAVGKSKITLSITPSFINKTIL